MKKHAVLLITCLLIAITFWVLAVSELNKKPERDVPREQEIGFIPKISPEFHYENKFKINLDTDTSFQVLLKTKDSALLDGNQFPQFKITLLDSEQKVIYEKSVTASDVKLYSQKGNKKDAYYKIGIDKVEFPNTECTLSLNFKAEQETINTSEWTFLLKPSIFSLLAENTRQVQLLIAYCVLAIAGTIFSIYSSIRLVKSAVAQGSNY